MEFSPVLDPVNVSNDVPLMVHIEADPEGCWIGLCGKQLRGINCDGQAIDCVVCADLARGMGWDSE